LGRAYFCLKRYDEAIEMLERGHALSGERPALLGALSQTHAAAGNIAEARRLLKALHEMSSRRHVPATCFAIAHLGLGEPEQALDFLDRGCAAREVTLASVKVHPIYDPLRGHPRFDALLKRMNFCDSVQTHR
jgi:serine/threonine-protein kinase